MFLVTTADERYWKTDTRILFLGEWCKRYSRRHIWSSLDSETLPYHWDDRQRLLRDFQLLAGVYERRLAALARQLNELHGEARSLRYWRIIVGPWLRHFIEALYDRFLSIEAAIQCGKVTATRIAQAPTGTWTPADFPQFLAWYVDDAYNHYLYSRIIAFYGGMPGQEIEAAATPMLAAPDANRNTPPLLRRLAGALFSCIPDALNRIVFVSSYLARWDQAKVQISIGQIPYLVTPQLASATERPDPELRRTLTGNSSATRFEELLDQLTPEQIPVAYVEGYRYKLEQALNAFPRNPRVMFTADAYSEDEAFKFWAAYQCERGAKLCVSQHGGNDGAGLWSSTEEHQIRISDRYYTWGWKTDATGVPCVPLSPGPLIRAKRRIEPRPDGQILWVSMSLPRYAYSMYSVPVGPQVLAYFDDQQRFAESVEPEVLDLLLLRLYPHDFGWDAANRLRDALPRLKTYQGRTPLIEQLNQSRLFVGTYNSTTYLETFVADFPTILFWNPAHWELRAGAQAAFDELRHAGILHDTPAAAAAKVNEIHRDPQQWWHQPRVQAAKDRFCDRFARVRKDWLREWKTELLQVADHRSSNR